MKITDGSLVAWLLLELDEAFLLVCLLFLRPLDANQILRIIMDSFICWVKNAIYCHEKN